MRIVIAPDSFKGSLSAPRVAAALAAGWREIRPGDRVVEAPVADGGEGTLDALVAAGRGRTAQRTVTGPTGRPVRARFGLSRDGRTAVVETAEASGLTLAPPDERDPRRTTTRGTGELIRAALDAGVERIVVGVGGSATNDGGAGAVAALGVRLLDGAGEELPPGGGPLARLARVDVSGLDPRLGAVEVVVAADVDNPLLGPRGASAVFGPQKGAGEDDVAALDRALTRYARLAEAARGFGADGKASFAAAPGAGAGGGLAFGLAVFLGGTIRSGADVVLDAISIDGELARADLAVTGEGRLDGQTAYGKAPAAVIARAAARGVPAVAVAGSLAPGYEALYRRGLAAAVAIAPGPMTAEESIAQAEPLLVAGGARLARLIGLGRRLGRGRAGRGRTPGEGAPTA